MTANHAHTPKELSTEFVRDMFEIAAVYTGHSESMEAATPHFNRWHSAEIATAEQRGAVKALRDAANSGLFVGPIADMLEARASQMEGDGA